MCTVWRIVQTESDIQNGDESELDRNDGTKPKILWSNQKETKKKEK